MCVKTKVFQDVKRGTEGPSAAHGVPVVAGVLPTRRCNRARADDDNDVVDCTSVWEAI